MSCRLQHLAKRPNALGRISSFQACVSKGVCRLECTRVWIFLNRGLCLSAAGPRCVVSYLSGAAIVALALSRCGLNNDLCK